MKRTIKYSFWALCLYAAPVIAQTDSTAVEQIYAVWEAAVENIEPTIKTYTAEDIRFVKALAYDKYTLEDVYPYKDTTRKFQWDKIRDMLVLIENAQLSENEFGVIQNRRNVNGEAALAPNLKRNVYKNLQDEYGVERYQSAPLYALNDTVTPIRYATDGCWLRIEGEEGSFLRVKHVYYDGEWYVPSKYIKNIGKPRFDHVACVDVTNQNIATVERSDSAWVVLSMNPATTGAHNPPYGKETPLGIFVVQEKKPKMYYLRDGTSTIAGFAPWASRFTNGGYIHGVPTNDPNGSIIEYGWTLGTTPRSHMCVRNASSHAKFVYDWTPVFESLVMVVE